MSGVQPTWDEEEAPQIPQASRSRNYYNEWDKDAASWLRELIKAGLIPDGDVDERSITEVKAHELTGYTQCHFFAGIGGWPLAFQLAGISPDENADTGSCPCQPFSGTGKQMGFADPRHLWPAFRRVIGKRQPATVYGEQVASKLGRDWLSRVFSDLAFMGYAGSGADLCSAGVGSPNIRQRLYWVGDAVRTGPLSSAQRRADCGEEGGGARDGVFERSGATDRLANPAGQRLGETRSAGGGQTKRTGGGCSALRLEHAACDGRKQRGAESGGRGAAGGCESGGLAEPHSRQRDGQSNGEGSERNGAQTGREQGDGEPESCGEFERLADTPGQRLNGISGISQDPRGSTEQERSESGSGGPTLGLGYADHARREGRIIRWDGGYERATGETSLAGPAKLEGFWGVADIVYCRDEKWRRIEPGSFPLANGIPSRVGPLLTELRKLGRSSIALARANRNIRLKGYGNAINPWVAAQFIIAARSATTHMEFDPNE